MGECEHIYETGNLSNTVFCLLCFLLHFTEIPQFFVCRVYFFVLVMLRELTSYRCNKEQDLIRSWWWLNKFNDRSKHQEVGTEMTAVASSDNICFDYFLLFKWGLYWVLTTTKWRQHNREHSVNGKRKHICYQWWQEQQNRVMTNGRAAA